MKPNYPEHLFCILCLCGIMAVLFVALPLWLALVSFCSVLVICFVTVLYLVSRATGRSFAEIIRDYLNGEM